MITHTDKAKESKSQPVANAFFQPDSGELSALQLTDNRVEAITQRKLQAIANNSPQAQQGARWQAIANQYATKQPDAIRQKKLQLEPTFPGNGALANDDTRPELPEKNIQHIGAVNSKATTNARVIQRETPGPGLEPGTLLMSRFGVVEIKAE